jgi:hypothetical protein
MILGMDMIRQDIISLLYLILVWVFAAICREWLALGHI